MGGIVGIASNTAVVMVVVFGCVLSLAHLPNYVECIGLANKIVVVAVTTFLPGDLEAAESNGTVDLVALQAIGCLICSSVTFAGLGRYFMYNCGEGFKVVMVGSCCELVGYLASLYFKRSKNFLPSVNASCAGRHALL